MRPLEELKETLSGHVNAYMEDETIVDQLDNWQGFSGDYVGKVLDSELALNEIDDNLNKKIVSKIELIKTAVDNFEATVKDENVTSCVEELNKNFIKHRREVDECIGTGIDGVERALNADFANIESRIKDLRNTKREKIESIKAAVQLAKDSAQKLLGEDGTQFHKDYTENILKRFNEIKEAVEKFTGKKGESSTLIDSFDTLDSEVKGLEDKVRHGLQELKDAINGLDTATVAKDALAQLQVAKEKLEKVTGSDKNAEGNLEKLFEDNIKNKLETEVRKIGKEIKKLCKAVGENGKETVNDF
ncbi:hypothetical protein, conserved [Babesia ovata]|nr:uncharacterized protein BOVATA_049510 [Babesia ovata]GBE63458.1 hypothetical protein, conserved [Babesia ovata]